MRMRIKTTDRPGGRHHRELIVDGESVSRLSIVDHDMRIGSATVKMGGIGGVHTDKEHRMKGYSRRVMTDSVEYMRDEGYDMSMLFGIRDFYPKFGYITALAMHRAAMTIPPEVLRRPQYRTRPMTDADIGAVIDLYNEDNRTRTCSVVRHHGRWTHFPKGSRFRVPATAFVVEDDSGTVVAYAAFDDVPDAVNIVEVPAVRDDVFPELVREFTRMAETANVDTIGIFAPPDHPFIEYCHAYDCQLTTTFRADGDGMLRIINLRSTFEKIRPVLEARLRRHAALAAGDGRCPSLRIATDIGGVVLEMDEASLAIRDGDRPATCEIELPQTILTQLIVGYRRVRSALSDDSLRAPGEAAQLAAALFPKAEPYIWAADHF